MKLTRGIINQVIRADCDMRDTLLAAMDADGRDEWELSEILEEMPALYKEEWQLERDIDYLLFMVLYSYDYNDLQQWAGSSAYIGSKIRTEGPPEWLFAVDYDEVHFGVL